VIGSVGRRSAVSPISVLNESMLNQMEKAAHSGCRK
jgi:hypothetical protein